MNKKLIWLFVILIILFFCLTCRLTINFSSPSPQATVPKDLLLITYAYQTSIKGMDIALFAESSKEKIRITLPGGKSPGLEDIQKMTSLNPAQVGISVIDSSGKTIDANTEPNGHLNLSTPFIDGKIQPQGWKCASVVNWETSTDNVIFPNGGAVLVCEKVKNNYPQVISKSLF